jgi:hypothetical protein
MLFLIREKKSSQSALRSGCPYSPGVHDPEIQSQLYRICKPEGCGQSAGDEVQPSVVFPRLDSDSIVAVA